MAEAAAMRRMFVTRHGQPLAFTALGFGGAPLGSARLDEAQAQATVEAAWDAGLRYFDTAPLYGLGLSEIRIGRMLTGKARAEFLISTKVGRRLDAVSGGAAAQVRFDYSRDGVLGSVQASLERLGLERVDILYVHDVEPRTHGSIGAYDAKWAELTRAGGWKALDELRACGAVGAIGLGVNEAAPCERMLAELDPDLFLLAGRYTLLEQGPLHGLMAACARAGVGVVVGGPYNSGVLARPEGTFDYAAAPAEVLARVQRLAAVCTGFGVDLRAAALQFAGAHPAVASVIPGGQTPEEAAANVALMGAPIPEALWLALRDEGLLDRDAPTPGAPGSHARAAAAC